MYAVRRDNEAELVHQLAIIQGGLALEISLVVQSDALQHLSTGAVQRGMPS